MSQVSSRLTIQILKFFSRLLSSCIKWTCWRIIIWMMVTLCISCRLRRWMQWGRIWRGRRMRVRIIRQKYPFTYPTRPRPILRRQWTCWVFVSVTTTPSTYPSTNNTHTSSNPNSWTRPPSSRPSSVSASFIPKPPSSTLRSTNRATSNSTTSHYDHKAFCVASLTWRTSFRPANTTRVWSIVLSRLIWVIRMSRE